MYFKQILSLSLLLFAFASCTPQALPTQDEKFSLYRQKFDYQKEVFTGEYKGDIILVPLTYDSTAQKMDITLTLNELLDYVPPKYERRITQKKFDGWRIQIYRGKSREDASKARQRSYELFPNVTPYMEYSSPTYRIKVGDFLDPTEYVRIYKVLKKEFPSAMIVPALVTITVVRGDN